MSTVLSPFRRYLQWPRRAWQALDGRGQPQPRSLKTLATGLDAPEYRPPLHFAETGAPEVTVVIPVFNHFDITYRCLKSIAEHRPNCRFEIVIVDDASSDETALASSKLFLGAVRILRNPENLGYVHACNNGARVARGNYLLFLNNDTLVQPGWLDELIGTFQSVPGVGIAGSKLLYPDGSLQEVGGIIYRLGDGANWGRNGNPDEPRYCYLRDSDYVSGAALMIRRSLFESLGGFDLRFAPGYYEDTDLCFRVRAAGHRVVVQPLSKIVHLEGVSSGRDVAGTGMKRFQAVNQHKFCERWGAVLANHALKRESTDLEAERQVTRRAFFMDDSVPKPDQDAGSNAALQHMLSLMRLGYKVTFIPARWMRRVEPYTSNLQKLGIECVHAPYFRSAKHVFKSLLAVPDLVYLHRYSNASQYGSWLRRRFPHCKILYNVADLHFLRQAREKEIEGALTSGPAVTANAEIAAMKKTHGVIVHSGVEAQLLRHRDPSLNIHTIPWTILVKPCNTPFTERAGIAFVGCYRHRPNVDAALYIARELMPRLRRSGEPIHAFLAGASEQHQQVLDLATEDLHVLGVVPDLSSLLHRMRCTVAPLRYGAGVKGKVLESFAHGIPCVMSEMAAEGLNLPGDLQWLVASSDEEMAVKARAIHEDQIRNRRLSELGIQYISDGFGSSTVDRLLEAAL